MYCVCVNVSRHAILRGPHVRHTLESMGPPDGGSTLENQALSSALRFPISSSWKKKNSKGWLVAPWTNNLTTSLQAHKPFTRKDSSLPPSLQPRLDACLGWAQLLAYMRASSSDLQSRSASMSDEWTDDLASGENTVSPPCTVQSLA